MTAKRKGQAKRSAAKRRREGIGRSVDQRLVKAMAHPMRVEILAILNDRAASPNELSKELEEGLSQVSYHVKVLRDFEMIEMVKTEPKRGAVEHYYKASQEVFFSSDELKLMPKSAQRSAFGSVLADIEQDVGTSLEAGTFDQRDDWVVARSPRVLDGKAREDAEDLAAEFLERYKELEVESVRRRRNGEGEGEFISSTAVLLVFGSMLGKKLKPSKKSGRRQ